MESIDLSVIIPTFRREDLLVKAIHSVLSIAELSIELIVVDDSPDASARDAVAMISDDRIRYFQSPQYSRGHPALLRNDAALSYARGRYFYFLDDDDMANPATLCELVRNLDQTDKGVGIAAVEPWGPEGSITVLDEVTHFRGSRLFLMKEGQSRPVLLASLLFGMPSITCGACIIRASVFHAVGGFDCVLPYYEDLDLYIKAIRHGGHVFLNKVLLYRRTGMPSLINDSYENPKHSTRCYRAINTSFRKQYGILEFFILRLIAAIFRKSRPRWPSFTHAFRREFAESDFVPKISSEIRGQLRHPTTV